MPGADASKVSCGAIASGNGQLGTLGSGNRHVEIQVADDIVDPEAARLLGISRPNQFLIMLHTGGRGLGHQVASDYLKTFLPVMGKKYGITVASIQLTCAPFASLEGQGYFKGTQRAVNMPFANRQIIRYPIAQAFSVVLGAEPGALGTREVYDVIRNTAKVERHAVDGEERDLPVHRKGATRAFPPGSEYLPRPVARNRSTGNHRRELGDGIVPAPRNRREGRRPVHDRARKGAHDRTQGDQWHVCSPGSRLAHEGSWHLRQGCVQTRPGREAGGVHKDIGEVIAAVEAAGLSRPVTPECPANRAPAAERSDVAAWTQARRSAGVGRSGFGARASGRRRWRDRCRVVRLPGVGLGSGPARAGEDLVESGELLRGQLDLDRLERGLQVLEGSRADDRRGNC